MRATVMTTRVGAAVAATVSRLSLVLAVSMLCASLAAEAQPTGKVYRIGTLSAYPPAVVAKERPWADHWSAFIQGLRAHGWIENQNFVFESRYTEGRVERRAELARELVALRPDVLVVTEGEPGIRALKEATTTIPIVMLVSADPVGAGLVSSLARPDGNVTGMSILAPPVGGKRLGLLREALPTVTRVAVLWNAADPAKGLEWKDTQIAANALGVRLQSVEVRGHGDFDTAFRTIAQTRPDALIVFSEPLTLRYQRTIVDFSAKNRLPLISEIREFAYAGGLMTYGASLADLYRRAANHVDKILKGAKPGDLPVEQPTKFELVINLKTAKALDLTIPPSMLTQADQIIEK